MEIFTALLAICAGNSPVSGEFPTIRPVTRIFDISFDLRLNKRLSKQSWSWWFETLPCLLWRQCNVLVFKYQRWVHMGFPKHPGTTLIWTSPYGFISTDWYVIGPIMTNMSSRTYMQICCHCLSLIISWNFINWWGLLFSEGRNTQFHDCLSFIHVSLTRHHVMTDSGVMPWVNSASYL